MSAIIFVNIKMIDQAKVALIKNLYSEYQSYEKVAGMLKMNRSTVMRIVKRDPNKPKAKRGPLKLITNKENTRIKKTVRYCNFTGAKCTARKIQSECDLTNVSKRTINRHMKTIKMSYEKAKDFIQLTKKQEASRVTFVKSWTEQNIDWSKVVYTDEKRFSLDGPDSWSTYTDEDRKIFRNKRQNKGGGIMLWGMITFDGLLYIIWIDGKFDSSAYCSIILDDIQPLLDDIFGEKNYYFQQDNCPSHVSRQTLAHIESLGMRILRCPARSPDLNLMENVWSWMVNHIYSRKSQYDTKNQLWEAIQEAVEYFNLNEAEFCKNLYRSKPMRILRVIEGRGKMTNY